MDNIKDRQFYWEVKQFFNGKPENNVPSQPKPSLKDAVSGVLKENNPYKQTTFSNNQTSVNAAQYAIQGLGAMDAANKPSCVAYTKNAIKNPFNLNESFFKKNLNEAVAVPKSLEKFLHPVTNEAGDVTGYSFKPKISYDEGGRRTMMGALDTSGNLGFKWDKAISDDWIASGRPDLYKFAADNGINLEKTGGVEGLEKALNKSGELNIPLKQPIRAGVPTAAPVASSGVKPATPIIPNAQTPLASAPRSVPTASSPQSLPALGEKPNVFNPTNTPQGRLSGKPAPLFVSPETPAEARSVMDSLGSSRYERNNNLLSLPQNERSNIRKLVNAAEPPAISGSKPPPLPNAGEGSLAKTGIQSSSSLGSKAASVGTGLLKGAAGLGIGAAADYGTQKALEALGVENETVKGLAGAAVGGAAGEAAAVGAGALMGSGAGAAAVGSAAAGGAAVGAAAYGGYKLGEYIGDKTGLHDYLGNKLGGASQLNTKATGIAGGDPALKARWDAEEKAEQEKLANQKPDTTPAKQPEFQDANLPDDFFSSPAEAAKYRQERGGSAIQTSQSTPTTPVQTQTPKPASSPAPVQGQSQAPNAQTKTPVQGQSQTPPVQNQTQPTPTPTPTPTQNQTQPTPTQKQTQPQYVSSEPEGQPQRGPGGGVIADQSKFTYKASENPEAYQGMDDRRALGQVPMGGEVVGPNGIQKPGTSAFVQSLQNTIRQSAPKNTQFTPSAGQYRNRGSSNMGMATRPNRPEAMTLQSAMAQQNQQATRSALGQMGAVQGTPASSTGFQGSVLPPIGQLSSMGTQKENEFKYSRGSRLA